MIIEILADGSNTSCPLLIDSLVEPAIVQLVASSLVITNFIYKINGEEKQTYLLMFYKILMMVPCYYLVTYIRKSQENIEKNLHFKRISIWGFMGCTLLPCNSREYFSHTSCHPDKFLQLYVIVVRLSDTSSSFFHPIAEKMFS